MHEEKKQVFVLLGNLYMYMLLYYVQNHYMDIVNTCTFLLWVLTYLHLS